MNTQDNNEDYGIVYALTNEAMPGLVKIGMTTKHDMNERLSQLFTTGVPYPFKCLYACRVAQVKKVEKRLHNAFDAFRVKNNREFFKIEPDKVVGILELLGPNDMQDEVNEKINEKDEFSNVTNSDDVNKKDKKKESYDFAKMGIPIGVKLQSVFKKQENIEVEVVNSRNKVRYNNEIVTLSNITQRITGYTHPTPWWTYNGKNLEVLWKESITDERCKSNCSHIKDSIETHSLKLLDSSDSQNEINENIDNTVSQIYLKKKKIIAKKSPNYNFSEMGIPIGAVLKLRINEIITVEVINSKNKVRWNGLENNLTRMTQIIYHEKFKGVYKNDKEPTRPILHWTYNGIPLLDIYNSTYSEILKEQENKKKVSNRWADCPLVTVTKSSKEEEKRLKEKSFERLENFVSKEIKRKEYE